MQDIKFRAYVKHLKILIEVQRINFDCKTVEWYIVHPDEWDMSEFSFDEIELMQFTWLKDKNLKEIYFWDILATSNQDKDYDIWEKEDYWYTVVEENIYELWIFYSKWHMTYDVESIYHFRFCEVIWNIYQNFELLWNQSK